jgi:hypothetical protein
LHYHRCYYGVCPAEKRQSGPPITINEQIESTHAAFDAHHEQNKRKSITRTAPTSITRLLQQVLDAAIEVAGADKGALQRLDERAGGSKSWPAAAFQTSS